MTTHQYQTTLRWTGNLGKGTADYRAYGRNYEIDGERKSAAISGSSDAHFRGDATRYNPEELLVASLSACHLLAYLHLCAVNQVVVTGYEDAASGTMEESPDGSGKMTTVVLRPVVTITPESDAEKAQSLHADAHRLCFIANSVNFPVTHEAAVRA
jgi:organic hydroperoxide reductase OsmC/OhrA